MLKDDHERISFRFAPYLAWTLLIHLSHGQIFISDEEFVVLVTFEPKKIQAFRFPYEAKTHNLTLMRTPSQSVSSNYKIYVERFAKPVPLFSTVYINILIDHSRILRPSWTSACC